MAGALMAANVNVPGAVSLALITSDPKGVSGSGLLATISFDLPANSADNVLTSGNYRTGVTPSPVSGDGPFHLS